MPPKPVRDAFGSNPRPPQTSLSLASFVPLGDVSNYTWGPTPKYNKRANCTNEVNTAKATKAETSNAARFLIKRNDRDRRFTAKDLVLTLKRNVNYIRVVRTAVIKYHNELHAWAKYRLWSWKQLIETEIFNLLLREARRKRLTAKAQFANKFSSVTGMFLDPSRETTATIESRRYSDRDRDRNVAEGDSLSEAVEAYSRYSMHQNLNDCESRIRKLVERECRPLADAISRIQFLCESFGNKHLMPYYARVCRYLDDVYYGLLRSPLFTTRIVSQPLFKRTELKSLVVSTNELNHSPDKPKGSDNNDVIANYADESLPTQFAWLETFRLTLETRAANIRKFMSTSITTAELNFVDRFTFGYSRVPESTFPITDLAMSAFDAAIADYFANVDVMPVDEYAEANFANFTNLPGLYYSTRESPVTVPMSFLARVRERPIPFNSYEEKFINRRNARNYVAAFYAFCEMNRKHLELSERPGTSADNGKGDDDGGGGGQLYCAENSEGLFRDFPVFRKCFGKNDEKKIPWKSCLAKYVLFAVTVCKRCRSDYSLRNEILWNFEDVEDAIPCENPVSCMYQLIFPLVPCVILGLLPSLRDILRDENSTDATTRGVRLRKFVVYFAYIIYRLESDNGDAIVPGEFDLRREIRRVDKDSLIRHLRRLKYFHCEAWNVSFFVNAGGISRRRDSKNSDEIMREALFVYYNA